VPVEVHRPTGGSVDGGYAHVVDTGLLDRARRTEQVERVVVARIAGVRGFQVLPRRWAEP
jgi:hypothetical protein